MRMIECQVDLNVKSKRHGYVGVTCCISEVETRRIRRSKLPTKMVGTLDSEAKRPDGLNIFSL